GRGLCVPTGYANCRTIAQHQGQVVNWLNNPARRPVKCMSKSFDYKVAEDEKLVRAAQRGNMVAFEELVARHRDKIYARAFSMVRNEDEALDLSQEAWVKGWQRLKQFQGDASFATWMTRIVINLCLDHLRKLKRTRAESIEQMDEEVGGVER